MANTCLYHVRTYGQVKNRDDFNQPIEIAIKAKPLISLRLLLKTIGIANT